MLLLLLLLLLSLFLRTWNVRRFTLGPLSRGERAEDQARRGARMMRARFPAYTDVRSENLRSPLANPKDRMSGGRGSGVPFLLVPFLWARKEKGPVRRMADGTRAGRARFGPRLGKKSDSSLRWNDEL